jgi:hypothetical protein
MSRIEDVTTRMSNITLSPTGKRVLAEARGDHDPRSEGDSQHHQLERLGRAAGMVAGRQVDLSF